MKVNVSGMWEYISVSEIIKLLNDDRYNNELSYTEDSVTIIFYEGNEYYPVLFTMDEYRFFYRMLKIDMLEKRMKKNGCKKD